MVKLQAFGADAIDDLEAAGLLGEWALRHGIQVDLDARTVEIAGHRSKVVMVIFTPR